MNNIELLEKELEEYKISDASKEDSSIEYYNLYHQAVLEIVELQNKINEMSKFLVEKEDAFICEEDIMTEDDWCENNCKYSCPQQKCYERYFELTKNNINN